MIVDSHAHLFHPKWYPRSFCDSLVKDYVSRSQAVGRNPVHAEETIVRMLSDNNGSATVKLMDKAGIDVKVILVLDWGMELGESASTIESIHRDILGICAQFKDRLLGFAGIDPRRPGAVELIKLAFDDLGAKGLKLHPTGGWRLSDERTHEVVELATARGFPVLVHVGRTIDILSDVNAQPKALVELAHSFPEGKFIAGHSGFELFDTFLNIPNLPKNIYFDVSGWQQFAQRDQVILDAYLMKLIQAFPTRVCYGSDSPFFTYNLIKSERGWLTLVTDFLSRLPLDLRNAASGILCGQDIFSLRPASRSDALVLNEAADASGVEKPNRSRTSQPSQN